MKRYLDFYFANARIALLQQFQYRIANYFYMIGMIAEPVIYLVVWSTIAEQQGGVVAGNTILARALTIFKPPVSTVTSAPSITTS